MRANFSPARKVLSSTAPVAMFRTLVRTKAPPMPVLNWLVQTTSAMWPCSEVGGRVCAVVGHDTASLRERVAGDRAHGRHQPEWLRRRPSSSGGDLQYLGIPREPFATVIGDEHLVFDAHALTALDVDAGLHGADLARLQAIATRAPQTGRLVHGEPDAMPGTVPEDIAVPCRRDDAPAGRIHIGLSVRPGTRGGQTGELSLEDHVVDRSRLRRRLPGREGPRDVAAVAVHTGAGVHDD